MLSDDLLLEVLEGARRYDNYIASLCPFHEDTRPSFMVWENYYKCYACGASGRTEDLSLLIRGRVTHYIKPAPFRNPWNGWIKRFGRLGLALKAAHAGLPSEYLLRRGIDEKNQLRLKLGLMDDWYTFPFFDESGKIIGSIARKGEDNPSPAKYVTPPGQNNRRTLYVPDWELLHRSRVAIVTFGILDAVSLALGGYGAISIIGLFVDASVFDFLRKNIFIVPDLKEEKFAVQLAAQLDWRGHAAKPVYPEGCKDLNDVFTKHPEQFTHTVKGILQCQLHGREHQKLSPDWC